MIYDALMYILTYDFSHAIESDSEVLIDEEGDLVLRMNDFDGGDQDGMDDWSITPGEARVMAARLLRGAAKYELRELAAGRTLDTDRAEERQAADAEKARAAEREAEIRFCEILTEMLRTFGGVLPRARIVIRDLILRDLLCEGHALSVERADQLMRQIGLL